MYTNISKLYTITEHTHVLYKHCLYNILKISYVLIWMYTLRIHTEYTIYTNYIKYMYIYCLYKHCLYNIYNLYTIYPNTWCINTIYIIYKLYTICVRKTWMTTFCTSYKSGMRYMHAHVICINTFYTMNTKMHAIITCIQYIHITSTTITYLNYNMNMHYVNNIGNI